MGVRRHWPAGVRFFGHLEVFIGWLCVNVGVERHGRQPR
jgi:hypothetical protein